MRKRLVMKMSILTMLILVACSSNDIDEATAEKYITQAEEVVSLLNEGAYTEVHAMFDEQMKAGLPAAQMEELTPVIEESGTFEKIDKASIEEKDGYYVVARVAKYSEQNRVFTVSFN